MGSKVPIIHRWQPTGRTLCGIPLERARWNGGAMLSDGVTCRRCAVVHTRISLPGQPHPPDPKATAPVPDGGVEKRGDG